MPISPTAPAATEREAARLAALGRYHVLDTEAEPPFDDIVRIAAQICGVPMALISLVDERRQWFKAAFGLGVSETPREIAFCAHAIQQQDVMLVEDAARDPRFADNPLVTGDPNLRFYAGAPLYTPDGYAIGTLCVLDSAPRVLSENQREALQALGRQVMSQLELRQALAARRRAETELRDFAASLEAQVESRLAAQRDMEERLRQSQKMEAIGQLTGGIAHDFNNLLAAILGSVALIRSRCRNGRFDALEPLIDAAEKSAKSAAALTARLLAFSRRQELDVKSGDINQLIAGMEDLLRRTLGETIELRTVLLEDSWHAMTDANQLENAILNLVINARDAMPAGGRLIIETANTTVTAAMAAGIPELSPGDYVAIAVSDTGSGMTPDVLARAFDPFFTTKPPGQGTGLGLSMIYGFAKQSAGHARIDSAIGRGTTIELLLPRGARAVDTVVGATTALPCGKGERVLVVEDDDTLRSLIMEGLKDLGYDLSEAADGQAALEVLDSDRSPELLLTDVGLPYMNGRQLAEIARQRCPGIKVLFLTGYAESAAVRGSDLEHDMGMLTKPFTLEALALRVQQLLTR